MAFEFRAAPKKNPAGLALVVQDVGAQRDRFYQTVATLFGSAEGELARMKLARPLVLRMHTNKDGYLEVARRLGAAGANVMVFQESAVGQGTTIDVTLADEELRATFDPTPPASAPAQAPPPPPRNRRTTFRGRRRF